MSRYCDDHDIIPAVGMECYECLLADRNNLRTRLTSALALIAVKDEALRIALSNAKEAKECADGTKSHNQDGDGDSMCEDGMCSDPGWDSTVAACESALAAKMKSEGI